VELPKEYAPPRVEVLSSKHEVAWGANCLNGWMAGDGVCTATGTGAGAGCTPQGASPSVSCTSGFLVT
jgi:hypothetical protein